jgi:MFS family permease
MFNLFIIGIGSYGFITSNHVWTLAQCKKNERLKAINLLDVVSNLGLALAGILIGFVSTNHFIYVFFTSSCLLCLTAFSLILLNKRQSNTTVALEDHEVSNPGSKIIYFVLLCLLMVGFIISQVNSTYPVYLQTIFQTMGTKSFGILFTLNAILVVIFQAPIVNWLGHINKILLMGLGGFLLGLGMFFLNFAYAFWVAIVSCVMTTTGEILFFSVAQLICYEKGSANKKGHSLGAFRAVYAISRVVGPAVGGVVYQRYNAESLWALCFMLGLFCMLTSYAFRKYD